MSSSAALRHDPEQLSLEELVAIQPRHLRGKLERGRRGPEGERPGRGRAQSLDFEGLAPYELGNDIRSIDWRASLRSGDMVARRFAAASHRARIIAVELKPSLYFATDERLMAKTACLTAAWLAWAANAANEPVGLASGDGLIAPRRGRKQVLRLLDAIAHGFREGRTGRSEAPDFDAMAGATSLDDEICLVCEPPDAIDDLIAAGRALSTVRKMRLFLVEDPMADAAPRAGRYPVRSAEGARRVLTVRGRADGKEDGRIAALMDAGWRVEKARDLLPGGERR